MYGLTSFLSSNARSLPHSSATSYLGRQQSWGEMQQRVARLAGAVRDLDVQPNDHVAVLALNSDRYLEFYFAVWWAGASVVPMNTRWSLPENVFALKDAAAKLLFIDDHFLPILNQLKAEANIENIVFMGEGESPEIALEYESLIDKATPCEDARRGGDDLAGLYYTGGTTGFPKGVMLSHQALWFNNIAVSSAAQYAPEDVYLHAAPMFHLADGAFSGAACTAGLSHVFMPTFDPLALIDLISKERVTHTLLVPTMLSMMLAHPQFNAQKLRTLKSVAYGASPMPSGLMQDLLSTLPWVAWTQGYGQTEMAPVITLLTPEYHSEEGRNAGKLRSAGRAAPGVELRICDADGNELPNGEVGEVVARSPGSMLGYWNREEETAKTLSDGWVKTGDGAYRDDEGFIFIVDRIKDMIITGGENVFSAEVESALSTHTAVESVTVIGIPDPEWGEAVHAIVIVKPDSTVTEEELLEHTKPLLANYKQPRTISFRDEPFPLSGAGKILKRELREPFWRGHDRAIS